MPHVTKHDLRFVHRLQCICNSVWIENLHPAASLLQSTVYVRMQPWWPSSAFHLWHSGAKSQVLLFDSGLRCGASPGVKISSPTASQLPWASPRPVSVFNNRNVTSQPGRVSDDAYITTYDARIVYSAIALP